MDGGTNKADVTGRASCMPPEIRIASQKPFASTPGKDGEPVQQAV